MKQFVATLALLAAAPQLEVYDEGTRKGVAHPVVNCVGDWVSCTVEKSALKLSVPDAGIARVQQSAAFAISPPRTTSSSTFTSVHSDTFTQTRPGSQIVVLCTVGIYSSLSSSAAEWQLWYADAGVSGIHQTYFNASNTHMYVPLFWAVTGESFPGTKVVDLFWRRASGSGVLNMNANDQIVCEILEL